MSWKYVLYYLFFPLFLIIGFILILALKDSMHTFVFMPLFGIVVLLGIFYLLDIAFRVISFVIKSISIIFKRL